MIVFTQVIRLINDLYIKKSVNNLRYADKGEINPKCWMYEYINIHKVAKTEISGENRETSIVQQMNVETNCTENNIQLY